MKQKGKDDISIDELINRNTALQCTQYYRIIKWNHENGLRIQEKAYELWEERERSGIPGNALADWYNAKSILLSLDFIT